MILPKLCGANIWIDWSLGGPLKDRLFEFTGTGRVNYEIIYQFVPYKRRGYPTLLTYDQITKSIGLFKPFLITPDDFLKGLYG